jgi:DNA-binding CsgD family transcriptional regulator
MTSWSCAFCLRHLTSRELAVAPLLAQGLSTADIAERLVVSPHTVAAHLAHMLRRLGARNRTEMVALLYSAGILASGAWPPRVARPPAPRDDRPVMACATCDRMPEGRLPGRKQ